MAVVGPTICGFGFKWGYNQKYYPKKQQTQQPSEVIIEEKYVQEVFDIGENPNGREALIKILHGD